MADRWPLRTHVQTGRARARCCDAAHAAARNGWHALAVSDGVSSRADTHFGAHLVSRAAVHAALSHLAEGGAFRDVPAVVQATVTGALVAVRAAIGRDAAASALPCTLVLLVAGADEAAAWFAGDGDAGLVGVRQDAGSISWTSTGDGCSATRVLGTPRRGAADPGSLAPISLHWRKRGRFVEGIPYEWLRPGPSKLQEAFHVRGDLSGLHGAFVATDGIPDALADLLLARPVATTGDVAALSDAPDDVGVAWGGPLAGQVARDHIEAELEQTLEDLGVSGAVDA